MGPGAGGLEALAEVIRVLADITRMQLLVILGEGEVNVTTLVERTGYDQPSVSHHLGILRRCRLVLARRAGKQVFYRLPDAPPAPGTICVDAGGGITVRVEPKAPAPHSPTAHAGTAPPT
jgi:DNA-binding transcriptional ArsR family regulator